jgi:hypothetical protein
MEAKKMKRTLYNPRTDKHTTLPYFERCFTLYLAVLSTVVSCLDTYDAQEEYESFYNDTRTYLNAAVEDGFNFRKKQVKGWIWRNGFAMEWFFVKDERTGTQLTERWRNWYAYVQHRTEWYLRDRIASLYLSQLGLHRMVKSFNSVVKAYNGSTGRNVATSTQLDFRLNGSIEYSNKWRQEAEQERIKQGWANVGVYYDFWDVLNHDMFFGPIFYEHSQYQHGSNWSPNGVNLAV